MLKNIILSICIFILFINTNLFAQLEAKNDSIDKLYERTINIANKLYKEKHYKESVAYYKSALKIKPKKKLAQFRIEDIITIFIKYDIASNRQEAEAIIEKVEEKIAEETKKEEVILFDIPKTTENVETTEEPKEEPKLMLVLDKPKEKPNEEPKEEHKPVIAEKIEVPEPIIEEKVKEVKKIVEESIVEEPIIKETVTEKPKKVNKQIKKASPVINQEEANKKMLVKYPDLKTVEHINDKNKKTTKVIINRNNRVSVFLKVEHNWGGVYYFIDNSHLGLGTQSITRRAFLEKTK